MKASKNAKFELTPEIIERAYDLLAHTPPFDKWNLPPGDEITFLVMRSKTTMGDYRIWDGRHRFRVSSSQVGSLHTLISLMAHEMIHLHQRHSGMETKAQHNAAFHKIADLVCAVHGFDRKAF